jgi:excisionase family DNA binding protein
VRLATWALMSVTDAPRRYLTLDQVAAEYQLSRRTIERLVAAGVLPSVRLGRSVRIPADALEPKKEGR